MARLRNTDTIHTKYFTNLNRVDKTLAQDELNNFQWGVPHLHRRVDKTLQDGLQKRMKF